MTETDSKAHGKEANVVCRLPVYGEIGQDFADDWGELKSVPRAGRRNDDVGVLRVLRNDEVLVGSQRVHAGGRVDQRPGKGGDAACE